MEEYRAYLIGSDGHIRQCFELVCDGDADAKERTKQLINGHDIELWQGTRRVAIFPRQHEARG